MVGDSKSHNWKGTPWLSKQQTRQYLPKVEPRYADTHHHHAAEQRRVSGESNLKVTLTVPCIDCRVGRSFLPCREVQQQRLATNATRLQPRIVLWFQQKQTFNLLLVRT